MRCICAQRARDLEQGSAVAPWSLFVCAAGQAHRVNSSSSEGGPLLSFRLSIATLLLCAGLGCSAHAALIINELDSDSVNTPTTDAFEFVELYDSSGMSVPLDGYVLVYYNGNGNVVYRAQDLDGLTTRANGYFIAG